MLPGRSYKAAVGFRHSTFVPTRPYVCLFAASATRLERRRHTAAKPLTSICCLAETTIDQHHNDSKTESSSDDRKKRRKPVQGPTVIAQSAAAASAGPLPEVLSATFPATFPTLSAARRVIRKDLVLVDGSVGSCRTEVAAGQLLQQLEAAAKHKPPREVTLEIAFEDESLAVVHKPWGVKMYGGDARRTITGALRAGALNPSLNPNALPEPKPVHRLDAAVGGLLVIAKTSTAVSALSAQFEGRRVHKVYHALLAGRLEPQTAVIDLQRLQTTAQQHQQGRQGVAADDSGSDAEDGGSEEAVGGPEGSSSEQQQQSWQELLQLQLQGQPPFTTSTADLNDPYLQPPPAAAAAAAESPEPGSSSSSSSGGGSSGCGLMPVLRPGVYLIDLPLEGKPCYTLLQVLRYSRAPRFAGWMSSVALSPVTGRKHQLRQHMAALGCPIVGDGRYALNKQDHISNQGIYLESLEVCFNHPATQNLLHVKIPEPQRFATLREQQHRRWNKQQAAAAAAAGSTAEDGDSSSSSSGGGGEQLLLQ